MNRLYRSYTNYVHTRRSRTADIFANSGMLAARSAIAEGRTAPGPRQAKVPLNDLAMPPLLPQQKLSRIVRTVSKDYDKDIDLAGFVRSDVSFIILRGLNENWPHYPPNSRMSDFMRQILIFVHNFVPTDDIRKIGKTKSNCHGYCRPMSSENVCAATIPDSSLMLMLL